MMRTFSTRATEVYDRSVRPQLRSPRDILGWSRSPSQTNDTRTRSLPPSRLLSGVAFTVALLAFSSSHQPALAQSDSEAGAEQLFNQARKLMKAKKYEAACAKFEASEELDPAPGTIVNLAVCYKKLGRLASAWSRFRKAADLDKRKGNRKRAKFARRAAAKLEKRLPTLVINVADDSPDGSPDSSIAGLAVTRNGQLVDRRLFGESVYVDPGNHKIEVTADGYEPYSTDIEAEEGERTEVDIPELEAKPIEQEPDESTNIVTGTPEDNRRRRGGKAGGGRRAAGLIMGGLGVVSVGVGLGFGYSAKSTWDGAFDGGLCDPDTLVCNAEGTAETDTARQRALLSNILVGAGVAVVTAGLIVYLTAPKKRSTESVSIAPVIGTDQWGMALSGHF